MAAVDARQWDAKLWNFAICPDHPSSKKVVGQDLPFIRSLVGIHQRPGLASTGVAHPMYEELLF